MANQYATSKKWYQSKTVITGLASIAAGIAGVVTGQLSPAEGVQLISTGAIGTFLRVAKD